MPGRQTPSAIVLIALIALILAPATLLPTDARAASLPPAFEVTRPANDGPLEPGSTAIVQADGDCLRMRSTPGLAGERVECIPHGATVLILPNTVDLDGYRWQFVTYRALSGWVADEFLRPYDGPPHTATCQSGVSTPGFTGSLTTEGGGMNLGVWGGGTASGILTTAEARGCSPRSVWATDDAGLWVNYTFGAPDFANQRWLNRFPGGQISSGTPIMVICQPPGTSAVISGVPLPLPTRSAPQLTGLEPAPIINARSAVIVDEASGAVIYDHNAYEPVPPASLTKIVTAILALEATDIESWVPVTDVDYRQMPGSSVMGLIPGDCFRMRDLLYGLMLPSGNDAALAIGRYAAGSDEAFVHRMNTLSARLGLTSSFTDPHGLGSPDHRMSAYDVAMFSRYAMTIPRFREIVIALTWTAVGDRDLSMRNVNSFITSYEGSDGVKTGFTSQAGRTLSASATRNGHRLYVVLMNANDRYADAEALLDWAFANHTWP